MTTTPSSGPDWDADRAAWLMGKVVLVSLTRLAADGTTVLEKQQFQGNIVSAEPSTGILVAGRGAHAPEALMLPPTTKPFLNAKPGTYRLKPSGEVVTDADVTVVWTITEPQAIN